jgi:hypothetical protein
MISFGGSLAFQSTNAAKSTNAAILSSLENVLPVVTVTTQIVNQKLYVAFWWVCLDRLPNQKFQSRKVIFCMVHLETQSYP